MGHPVRRRAAHVRADDGGVAGFLEHADHHIGRFIVHWPSKIPACDEIRTQYAHAIDMAPTVPDLLGVDAPASIKVAPRHPEVAASASPISTSTFEAASTCCPDGTP